jgi:hypothetical protein
MNRVVYTLLAASTLISSAAFAQSAKHVLADSQMDRVTAGSAIAIDDASVTTSNTGSVSLSGSSLSGASGLNIVSSSNSLVANNANIAVASADKGQPVNQINISKQTEGSNAQVALAVQVPIDSVDIAAAAQAKVTDVAADNGKISTTNNYSVDLSGAAEQNATALNIVNAAGGLVTNNVNIAVAQNTTSAPTLNQVNVSVQSSR